MHLRPQFFRDGWFALVLLLFSPVLGAAPKLDWVYPSSIGPGMTTTLTVSDTSAWPVQVWMDTPDGITIEAAKEKGKLTITTTADAKPGMRWVRLHNAEGASAMRPLIIGSLPTVEEVEPNNAVNQAQKVSDRIAIQGRLDKNGDVDGYRVSLKAGQTFIVALTANQILASPMDGVLQLCDGDGHVLTQSDDEVGLDPRIVHQVKHDGDYIVRCFAFPAAPNSSISFAGGIDYIYQLTLTTGPFADHAFPMIAQRDMTMPITLAGWNLTAEHLILNVFPPAASQQTITVHHASLGNSLSIPLSAHPCLVAQPSEREPKPQSVALPCVITGRLSEASHKALFRFTTGNGQKLRIRAQAQSLGFPLDPVLTVRDATGKVITETDDTGKDRDPSYVLTPAADSEYEVMVRDLHQRGGFRFVYRLSLEPVVPDVALTLAADRFAAAAGKPVEIAVTVERRDGFAEDLDITLEGLPEAVVVKPVVSKMKDGSEKAVKLVVPAGAATWSGPVRVIATAGSLQRAGTFAATGESRHDQVWLTLPGGKK